jgi:DMSO/TMAO reductase YedYZ heme-binding membrane subunit
VALGTLAGYTVVLVAAVGLARGRIAISDVGARTWRWVHGLAYVTWALAMLHGIKSGTDTGVGWVEALYVACGAVVGGAIAARIAELARRSAPRRHADPAIQHVLAGQR